MCEVCEASDELIKFMEEEGRRERIITAVKAAHPDKEITEKFQMLIFITNLAARWGIKEGVHPEDFLYAMREAAIGEYEKETERRVVEMAKQSLRN